MKKPAQPSTQGRLVINSGASQPARGRAEPPRPVQLGSLKSENEGQDTGIRLVPAGGGGWGRHAEKKDEPDAAAKAKPKAKPALVFAGGALSSSKSNWGPGAQSSRLQKREVGELGKDFPSLGGGTLADGKKRTSWADEDFGDDFDRPAWRLTDSVGAQALRPTVNPPPEARRPVERPNVWRTNSATPPRRNSPSPPRRPLDREDRDLDSDSDRPLRPRTTAGSGDRRRVEEAEKQAVQEQMKKLAKQRADERKAEEEAKSREQFARAQEKLRQLDQRAMDRKNREKARLEELRNPNRPSVWDNLQSSRKDDPDREQEGSARRGDDCDEDPASGMSAMSSPVMGPDVNPKRRLPPPPVEQAPPPPTPPQPPTKPPPAPPPLVEQRGDHRSEHRADRGTHHREQRAPPPAERAPPPPDSGPPPRERFPSDGDDFDFQLPPNEENWQHMRPPAPSLTGDSVWGPRITGIAAGPALDVAWPGFETLETGQPLKKKERKPGIPHQEQKQSSGTVPEREAGGKGGSKGDRWWSAPGRKIPSATFNLQDLVTKPLKAKGASENHVVKTRLGEVAQSWQEQEQEREEQEGGRRARGRAAGGASGAGGNDDDSFPLRDDRRQQQQQPQHQDDRQSPPQRERRDRGLGRRAGKGGYDEDYRRDRQQGPGGDDNGEDVQRRGDAGRRGERKARGAGVDEDEQWGGGERRRRRPDRNRDRSPASIASDMSDTKAEPGDNQARDDGGGKRRQVAEDRGEGRRRPHRNRAPSSDPEEKSGSDDDDEERNTMRIDPQKPLRILQKPAPPQEEWAKEPKAAASGSRGDGDQDDRAHDADGNTKWNNYGDSYTTWSEDTRGGTAASTGRAAKGKARAAAREAREDWSQGGEEWSKREGWNAGADWEGSGWSKGKANWESKEANWESKEEPVSEQVFRGGRAAAARASGGGKGASETASARGAGRGARQVRGGRAGRGRGAARDETDSSDNSDKSSQDGNSASEEEDDGVHVPVWRDRSRGRGRGEGAVARGRAGRGATVGRGGRAERARGAEQEQPASSASSASSSDPGEPAPPARRGKKGEGRGAGTSGSADGGSRGVGGSAAAALMKATVAAAAAEASGGRGGGRGKRGVKTESRWVVKAAAADPSEQSPEPLNEGSPLPAADAEAEEAAEPAASAEATEDADTPAEETRAPRTRRERGKNRRKAEDGNGSTDRKEDLPDEVTEAKKKEPKPKEASQEILSKLHPVDDTGLAVGGGMVCVAADEEISEGDLDTFETVKTKKQQKTDRQEQQRAIEEEARREVRREARRLRKERARAWKNPQDSSWQDDNKEGVDGAGGNEDVTAEAPIDDAAGACQEAEHDAPEPPKRAAINLMALKRNVVQQREDNERAREATEIGDDNDDDEDRAVSSETATSREAVRRQHIQHGGLGSDWVPQLHGDRLDAGVGRHRDGDHRDGHEARHGASSSASSASLPPAPHTAADRAEQWVGGNTVGESTLFSSFPSFCAVSEPPPQPSKEIAAIWDRPAFGTAAGDGNLLAHGHPALPSRGHPPPFPAPNPMAARMMGPHGPPPPYKPPLVAVTQESSDDDGGEAGGEEHEDGKGSRSKRKKRNRGGTKGQGGKGQQQQWEEDEQDWSYAGWGSTWYDHDSYETGSRAGRWNNHDDYHSKGGEHNNAKGRGAKGGGKGPENARGDKGFRKGEAVGKGADNARGDKGSRKGEGASKGKGGKEKGKGESRSEEQWDTPKEGERARPRTRGQRQRPRHD